MGFGKLLEQKMQEKEIKQSELAAAVGIPKTTLNSIISRDNTKIEIEVFLKICEYLNCDPDEFYNNFRREKSSLKTCDLLTECHESEIYNVVKLLMRLDTFDLGRVAGNVEEMLKAEKYTAKSPYSEESAS
ncbi:MAG: helix-turn-helix transcriptional regulator [Ruminococcus sp.]|nr:helix-turn-helix transcriptional regulator [Ruminococcus sp.]MCM1380384.1 helix-turn-helix transcriptional regulator [Muribaculaceae bacterium]MCM1478306.1 helix-turn-helix transcriptional regulator [Muribaculaceae bacterium]